MTDALREGRSGVRFFPEYSELGLRSCVAGVPDITQLPPVDRKLRRFMGEAALYAYHAAREAIADAALSNELLQSTRTALIVGSGTGSLLEHTQTVDTFRAKGIAKVLPYTVPRTMGSTVSANLSTAFGIRGRSYSITSACTTAAHNIGHAAELIQSGKHDVVISGGAEEVCWTSTLHFDAMGALSSRHENATASRPYDSSRDGFVIAGGAGILVVEELEHARKRGAHIHAEIVGYGTSSDGDNMVSPDSAGAARAMRLALDESGGEVDYINTHGTSTVVGDIAELLAIRDVFGARTPPLSSTKGLTGHSIAASAAHEAIYSMLMMEHGFLAGCAHVEQLDPATGDAPLLLANVSRRVDTIMSNSFGFGGTNVSLIFRRVA